MASKKTKPSKGGLSVERLEVVVALLAGFILIFGIAGYMATDGVQLGFKLLQSPKSMAAMATEDGLFTDEGIVSFTRIRGIINNLQLFTYCAIFFGATVCGAFCVRIWRTTKVSREAR